MSSQFFTVVGEGAVLVVRVRERNRDNYSDGHIVAKCDSSEHAYLIAEALAATEEPEHREIPSGEFGYG